METSSGIRASLAGRYASALFDLARDERQIEAVSRSLELLAQALVDLRDFAELVSSPLIGRDEAGKALAAIAGQLSLDPITTNFLGVLARNGRKNQLQNVIRAFRRLAADHRGETTAEVVTAHALKRRPACRSRSSSCAPAPAATSRSKRASTLKSWVGS